MTGTILASPAVDRVELTVPGAAEQLRDAGPVVLWHTGQWALVQSGHVENAVPVLERTGSNALFLVLTASGDPIPVLPGLSIEMEPGVFLVEAPVKDVESLVPRGVEIIRLDRLYTLPEVSGRALPEVNFNETVQNYVNMVSRDDLMGDLITLVDFETRNSYADGCEQAGAWIYNLFASLGLGVEMQYHRSNMGPNVIGELTGQINPDEIVIICGHYDSVSMYPQTDAPGADDNGTGTAATLQAAKILGGNSFDKTIRFIAFSGEEQGLLGSAAYAAQARAAGENIIGVFNFDMIGWVEPYPEDLDCIANSNSRELMEFFVGCAQVYTGLLTDGYVSGAMGRSDHASFWNYGFSAICGIEDSPIHYPYYHSREDTVDKINAEFFTDVTRGAVAAVAQMAVPATGGPDPTPTPDPDQSDIGVEIVLNNEMYRAGDFFHLGVTTWNETSESLHLPLCIVLETAGQYWFWPGWQPQFNSRLVDLAPTSRLVDEYILEFVWPDGAGQMSGLMFRAAFLTEDMTGITGAFDSVEWGYM